MNRILSFFCVSILVFSIFGYPIIAMIAVILKVDNQNASMAFRSIILFFSLLVVLFTMSTFLKAKRPYRTYLYLLSVLFFFLFFAIRAAVDSIFSGSGIDASVLFVFWVFLIGVTFLPSVASALGWKFFLEKNLFLCKLGSTVGLFAVVLIIFVWGYSNGPDTLLGGRIEFSTLNPISIGHVAVSFIIFAYVYYSTSKSAFFISTPLFYASVIIAVVLLISAGSRGPMLSLLMVFLFGVFFNPRMKMIYKISAVFLAMSSIVLTVVMYSDLMIVERMTTGLFSDPARIAIFEESKAVFLTDPVFGAGILSMDTYPHNFVLESFVVSGLFAGLLFVFINFISVYAAVRVYREGISAVVPLLFIQYFVAGIFSGTIHEASNYWILLVILLCMSSYNYQSSSGFYLSHNRVLEKV